LSYSAIPLWREKIAGQSYRFREVELYTRVVDCPYVGRTGRRGYRSGMSIS
jgi:hypothetical protein